MGNTGSSGAVGRLRHHGHPHRPHAPPSPVAPSPTPVPPAAPPQEAAPNRYVFAAATPYPPQYPQYYHQYSASYYPPPPPPPPPALTVPLPAPYDHHHRPPVANGDYHPHAHSGWVGAAARYPYGPPPPMPAPYVEHQKAVTIRNDINIRKETLRIEADEEDARKFLVAFTFDATVAGSITVYFFAKEGIDCHLTASKEHLLKPVTVSFKEGLGQKFRQSSGTGIDFSLFDDSELLKEGELDVYPVAVKAEATPSADQSEEGENQKIRTPNSQITQAIFEKKENGEYAVRVARQILWVNGTRYELQEIYGIGSSVDSDADGNDPGKECVICLSEPRDTTVLPCRHMCMCSECAKVLRFQTNRCPICRQPVERLLEIKVNNKGDEQQQETAC